jgi:hypothetical protein
MAIGNLADSTFPGCEGIVTSANPLIGLAAKVREIPDIPSGKAAAKRMEWMESLLSIGAIRPGKP